MDYRIENMPSSRLIGVSSVLGSDPQENYKIIEKFWNSIRADGTLDRLIRLMDPERRSILGVCDPETNKYWIAVASEERGFDSLIIPDQMWAVFGTTGTYAELRQLEMQIISEWLPESGYKITQAPEVEVYRRQGPETVYLEVWVPVANQL